jgi:hypothetical protein
MTRSAASICLSLLLSMHGHAIYAAQPKKPGLVALGDYDCLPGSTFGLANIKLWEPRASVIRKLGKPDRTTKKDDVDDGGHHVVSSYHYKYLSIDIVRGDVDRMYTTNPHQRTPEGIRVGDSRAEVIRKLGARPRDWNSTDSKPTLHMCEKGQIDPAAFVTYTFGKGGQLLRIEYEADRP